MIDKILSKLTKILICVGLTFYTMGIVIALYVGYNVVILDKDLGGGKSNWKRLEKIHERLHSDGQ
jgi:hypothetical protein